MALELTLLDLVNAVSDSAASEAEVVATVVHLVNSGIVQLCGNFRGARFDLDAVGLAAAAGPAGSRAPGGDVMYAETGLRRMWVAGHAIDVWQHPQVLFSWTPSAIQGYIHAEQWESVFNALVLLADSDPKGLA